MKFLSLSATVSFVALISAHGAQAQFGGGKPKVPEQRALDTYQQVVLTENLSVPAVSPQLASAGSAEEIVEAGLDPKTYRGTLGLLQRYIQVLASHGPRPDVVPSVNLKLALVADAYAPNSHEIVLTTGLLDTLLTKQGNDKDFHSAVAFIIGHEYAHVLYDHPARYAEKEQTTSVTRPLSSALNVATQMQGLSAKISPGLAQANQQASTKLAGALSVSPLIDSELYRFGVAPYKKDQESLADFLAVDLMRSLADSNAEAALMNPRAGIQALDIFKQYDDSITGQLKAGAKRLDKELDEAGDEIEGQAKLLTQTFDTASFMQNVQGSLIKGATDFLTGILTRRFDKNEIHVHYSSDKRLEGVESYLDKFYEPVPDAVSADMLAAFGFASAAQFTDTFANEYAPDKASSTAKLLLSEGDIAGARAAMDAVAPSSAKSAHFHEVDGAVWQEMGEVAKAEQSYEQAIKFPDARLSTYSALSQTEAMQSKYDQAWATLDLAEKKFGPTSVIEKKIQLLLAQERNDEAKALAATCANYGEDWVKRCEKLLPPEESKNSKGLLGIGIGGV